MDFTAEQGIDGFSQPSQPLAACAPPSTLGKWAHGTRTLPDLFQLDLTVSCIHMESSEMGFLSVIHIAKKLKLTQEEMILSLLLSSCPWLPSRALRGWGYKMEHHSHLQGLWLGKKWEFWCLLAGPMFGSSFSVFLYFLVSNRPGHQMGIRV